MERADRVVSVHHGTGGGRIYSGVAGARLPGGGGRTHLPAGAAHGAGISAGCAAAAATASGPSGALAGDVLHSAQHLGHGHVRLCVPVVSDGGAGAGNLARLPARDRAVVAVEQRLDASGLQGDDARFQQHQRALAGHRRSGGMDRDLDRHSFGLSAARLCRIHLRLDQGKSLVVVAADAGGVYLFGHGIGDCRV